MSAKAIKDLILHEQVVAGCGVSDLTSGERQFPHLTSACQPLSVSAIQPTAFLRHTDGPARGGGDDA